MLHSDEGVYKDIIEADVVGYLVRLLSATPAFSVLEYAADTIETLSKNGIYHTSQLSLVLATPH